VSGELDIVGYVRHLSVMTEVQENVINALFRSSPLAEFVFKSYHDIIVALLPF
jgi:hypothetical protein